LPEELFPGASGLLKPKIVEGVLTVGYVDIANGPTTGPPREIPVVLSLGSCRSSVRDILRFVLCLLLLLGGGLASLFLHQSIPNRFRRLAIRTRLDAVVGQTKRLSAHIPGALRVALRVQRLELSRRLGNEVAFFPGASETYEDVAQQADVLARRIELIGKIDERLRLIEHMGRSGPPHLLHLEKRRLAGALPALSTKTPETAAFAATAQLIVEVDAAIKRIRDEDPGVREGLEKTALEYWRGRFQPQWELVAQNKKEWASDLIQQLSGFATHARRCFSRQDDAPASGALAEETLASIDTALAKMKLVVNYIRVCESATPEQEKRFNQPGLGDDDLEETQKPSQRQRFFACLSGTGARTLEQARLLLRQAAQGIFVKELAEQITRGKFRLCAEPQSVAPFDPVTFRYVFWEDKYNDAAAREKLDCVWTFKHGTEEHEEACWEAVQFFPSGGLHAVRVRVARGAKVFAPKPQALEALEQVVVHVSEEPKTHFVYLKPWRWPERAKLEGVQLGVTLVVTMGALVSGALEQIEKLDLWAAMSAIVGLGFGADVLTKIVARRPTNRPAAAQTT
jgi:hypothetical protein